MNHSRLLAIRISRRAIAIAGFDDQDLNFLKVHQISSDPTAAATSSVGFVRRFATLLEVDSAALELVRPEEPTRRTLLTRTVQDALRNDGIPVCECTKQDLFEAFGVPPLRKRKELRSVVATIWPDLDRLAEADLVMDAAALGLHVQVQRLFRS